MAVADNAANASFCPGFDRAVWLPGWWSEQRIVGQKHPHAHTGVTVWNPPPCRPAHCRRECLAWRQPRLQRRNGRVLLDRSVRGDAATPHCREWFCRHRDRRDDRPRQQRPRRASVNRARTSELRRCSRRSRQLRRMWAGLCEQRNLQRGCLPNAALRVQHEWMPNQELLRARRLRRWLFVERSLPGRQSL